MLHREECKDYMGSNQSWRLTRIQKLHSSLLSTEPAWSLRFSSKYQRVARLRLVQFHLRHFNSSLTNSHVLVMRTKDHRAGYIRLRFRSRSPCHCPTVLLNQRRKLKAEYVWSTAVMTNTIELRDLLFICLACFRVVPFV